MYIYNVNTGTLHIEGYCQYAKAPFSSSKSFDTEKAARDFAGEKIQMCKVCQEKREKIMKEKDYVL